MKLFLPESRTAQRVLVCFAEEDKARLARAVQAEKIPAATLAYLIVREWLEAKFGEEAVPEQEGKS